MNTSFFTSNPNNIEYLDLSESGEDSIKFRTTHDVEFNWKCKSYPERRITVPKNFTTDFASVPKFFRNFIPNIAGYNRVALLHDYLYTVHTYSRAESDAMFEYGCTAFGLPAIKAWIAWVAIRICGFKRWNN